MANSIFDLFSFDFSDLVKKLEDLKVLAADKYDDFVNNNLKKYDLDTEEGYTAFINDAAEIRTKLLENNGLFSNKLVELLDSIVEREMKRHTERKANKVNENKVDELIRKEVNRNVNENSLNSNSNSHCSETPHDDSDVIDWPSSKLNPKQKRNVWRLVDEYMDNMVIPYIPDDKFDEEAIDDMSSGLFEFAAWLLNKE